MATLWRKCKISDQERSIFLGTVDECLAYKLELLNKLLIEALTANPQLDEDTILAVEDAYFYVSEPLCL
jgi:hypothetical protein